MLAGCIAGTWWPARDGTGWLWVPLVARLLVVTTLVVVPPGQGSVVQFFGRYVGTVGHPGFWAVLPLTLKRRVSVRVRNFETGHLKVNDADGNPVEIAAIVVWQVADTAKATYAVDSYENFVSVQSESALRHVATSHPYDDTSGRRNVPARLHRRRRGPAGPGGRGTGGHRRGRDRRSSHLAPRLLT